MCGALLNLQEVGGIAQGFAKVRENTQEFAEFAKKTENCADVCNKIREITQTFVKFAKKRENVQKFAKIEQNAQKFAKITKIR